MNRLGLITSALLMAAACSPGIGQRPSCGGATIDGVTPCLEHRGVYSIYPDEVPAFPEAPAGYSMCYLSHYGRHGSRYLQYDTQYVHLNRVLQKAHDDGKLSVKGEDVYERFMSVYPQLKGRGGELTPEGQRQHRAIASRMVRNCPRLFRNGSRIEIRTTNLERTMLSMAAFTNELSRKRKGLDLRMDGSRTEMNYLNPHSKENPECLAEYSNWRSTSGPWRAEFRDMFSSKVDLDGFAGRIFTDKEYAVKNFDVLDLETDLYYFSLHACGCPGEVPDFFDIFTSSDLEALWQMEPFEFYVEKGRFRDPRAQGPALAHILLEDFIAKTDEDMANGVSARLRFGHDGCMASLFALMKVEGWGQEVSDLRDVWGLWDTDNFPMAANLQLVFYSKGDDIIFTSLLNEAPFPLPLEETAPGFYRWSDFKEKYDKSI